MNRILTIRACALGDFVLNLPALRALQERETDTRFTLVGYPSTLEWARRFITVEAIYSIELQPWSQLFYKTIPPLRFERAIVWMKEPAFAENLRRSGVGDVLRADPFPSNGHAATHLLNTIGLPAPELPDCWRPDGDRVILHPGSGSLRKNWPHFRELASRLKNPAFLIGPAEKNFDTCGHARLENQSLEQAVQMLSTARAFVGNDSGITHLSAYLGCPTIALFGPTDPAVWSPIGRRVQIVRDSNLSSISPSHVLENLGVQASLG